MNTTMPYDPPLLLQRTQALPHSRIRLYEENDKVMILETGEVFTVQEDRSDQIKPGISVQEKLGRLLRHGEVRPAGRTRQRRDLERWIVGPDAPPPVPEDCVRLDAVEDFSEELHPD